MRKECILKAFDKSAGYGAEYGDFADYVEITPIREEFIRLINQLYEIESMAAMAGLDADRAKIISSEITKEALPK